MKLYYNYTHSDTGSYLWILIASTFLMATSFPAGKILLSAISPFPLVGWRFLLAAVITLFIAWFVHGNKGWMPRVVGKSGLNSIIEGIVITLLIGIFMYTGAMGLLYISMQTLPASTAAILLFTNPFWVALFGKLVLNEHLSFTRIIAIVLGFTGTVLVIGLNAGGSLSGVIAGLGGAVCWAIATILSKRFKISGGHWFISGWQLLIGALALLGIATLEHESWPETLSLSQWIWFIWLAIPASTGSFGLWFLALKRGGATHISGYLFLVPLFAVFLGYLILGERLTAIQLFGGVLILFALWLGPRNDIKKLEKEIKIKNKAGE